jgi:hypothetical protein
MPAPRRVRATFSDVSPASTSDGDGVELEFRLLRKSQGMDVITQFAPLGPDHCIPVVSGIGKVLRILRAARIATPGGSTALLGQVELASELLERALGTALVLELRPRSRLRFEFWTEESIDVIENVSEVVETPDAYLVLRTGGRFPVHIARNEVIRQHTETQRWFEILSIERG